MANDSRAKPHYWTGLPPNDCDLCKAPIITAFIDGATSFGPWANMCPKCHTHHGRGFGTGRGQRYEKQSDGRWLKTEG